MNIEQCHQQKVRVQLHKRWETTILTVYEQVAESDEDEQVTMCQLRPDYFNIIKKFVGY